MKLIWLPLEPLEERYTADWSVWFPQEFHRLGIDFLTVEGRPLTSYIETGRFLDVFGTIYYKSTQMAQVAKLMRSGSIESGDIIFDADLWRPGLEAIPYMAQLAGLDIKVVGILHAGTYDPHDFTAQAGLGLWAEQIENGWLSFIDTVFVGSVFHKELLERNRDVKCSIKVTGLPFYGAKLRRRFPITSKEPIVVFPHRLDPEKNPHLFDELESAVGAGRFVKTVDVWEGSKTTYYELLSKSTVAVSFADQETFGYAIAESVALGCTPVLPRRLSYPEIYPEEYLFDTFEEAVAMTRYYLENPKPCPEVTFPYANAIERMVSSLL